jgi:hypothetical protein
MFPISLLEPYYSTDAKARKQQELADIEPEAPDFEVEAILAYQGLPIAQQYLIK